MRSHGKQQTKLKHYVQTQVYNKPSVFYQKTALWRFFVSIRTLNIMIYIRWVDTNLPTQYEQHATSLQQKKQWSAVKLFYRQHMAYARVSLKESVAVIYQHKATTFNTQSQLADQHNMADSTVISDTEVTKTGNIIAAVRIKHLGQYQLISGLLVAPEQRRKALATKLLNFIAPALTPQKCFLFTNISLQRLYQQQQFQLVSQQNMANLPAEIAQLHQRYHNDDRPLIVMQLQCPSDIA